MFMRNVPAVVNAEVTALQFHADGSGCPAVVHVGPFAFAFDTLGTLRFHRLDTTRYNRATVSEALRLATKAYTLAVDRLATPEWRKLNAEMYAK